MPESTAENSIKLALVARAIIFASVVFPTPGGPQKISEAESSLSICNRSGFPAASKCVCPKNSSSVHGRMRSASGDRCGKRSAVADDISGAKRLTASPPRDAARSAAASPHTKSSIPQPPHSATPSRTESSAAHPPAPALRDSAQHLHCRSSPHTALQETLPSKQSHSHAAARQQTAATPANSTSAEAPPAALVPPAYETQNPPTRAPPSRSTDSPYPESSSTASLQTLPPTAAASPNFRGLAATPTPTPCRCAPSTAPHSPQARRPSLQFPAVKSFPQRFQKPLAKARISAPHAAS